MSRLTTYIIPSEGNLNIARAMQFHSDDNITFVSVETTDLLHVEQKHPYGFIYDNEWFDKDLLSALPVFLEYEFWDILVVFKKVIVNGEEKFFETPRVFKPYVKLKENQLVPADGKSIMFTKVLDGWLLEDDRSK